MPLDMKNIDDIVAADITALIEAPEREGQKLEFKQALPGSADNDKKEFLADVSAFANAIGGDIVYGIAEGSGEASAIVPLSGDPDADIRRLESMARSGIDPRIPNLKLKTVTVEGGYVLIVRIPRSWAGPHVVTHSGVFRFYTRTSAGKHQLDIRELRTLFELSESIEQRIRNFRADRVARVTARDEGISLEPGPSVIVHVLPLGHAPPRGFDIVSDNPAELRPLTSPYGLNWRHNLDGFLVFWPRDGTAQSYTQLFRDGAIEMADAWLLSHTGPATADPPEIMAEHLETKILEGVARAVATQEKLGASPPLVVLVTIVGVRGYLLTPANTIVLDEHSIDRDALLLPEVVIQETPFDAATVLKPAFDALWNAAGWPRSLSYDSSSGRRKTR